ncbi:hypothetical protein CW713_05000 [Methanophagales archaeon]|nr:MAG: hypothetical protein CW713_05000 [Methanophagales archaeon]
MSEEYEHKELRRRQEKLESEIKEIENRLKELRVRGEEREKLIGKFWKERAVYITIIVGSISILLTIIIMITR